MGEALASIIDPKGCPTMSKPSVGEALASISVEEASASVIDPEGSPTASLSLPLVGTTHQGYQGFPVEQNSLSLPLRGNPEGSP